MPDKPTTVAAYAAGASLAAITIFYVFGPTFFIDGENGTTSGKKKTIVGLANQANDCFINSVLQALSGLGDLRLFLIREIHRRKLDGPDAYESLPDLKQGDRPEKIRELQQGLVTRALKDMLDALNERPIYKKTVTAKPFIDSLERAFRTRISRNQQDAQEFLQVVAERLCDEYHAGVRARRRAQLTTKAPSIVAIPEQAGDVSSESQVEIKVGDIAPEPARDTEAEIPESEYGFPLEGQIESQIECQHCQFQYKPNRSGFVSLTLNVPQKSSATLSSCFDGLLKTEYIDDFKCDKCRLLHAIDAKNKALENSQSADERAILEKEVATITETLETDPEKEPEGVEMPASSEAPKRKIAKHMRLVLFPKIMAVHLSRSIFDPGSYSTKNAAKVSFPERLRLGGLMDEKWYKLLGIVCHKGSHNSGHYESFRRQHQYPPYSTPDVFSAYASYSRAASPMPSNQPSPRLSAVSNAREIPPSPSTLGRQSDLSTPSASSTSLSTPPSRSSLTSQSTTKLASSVTSAPQDEAATPRKSVQSERSGVRSMLSPSKSHTGSQAFSLRRKKKVPERWWRVSDDKVKECKTGDVLGMQKEVYLLFYELEKPEDSLA